MVDTSVKQLLRELHRLGIRLWVEEGRLRSKAPKGVMPTNEHHKLISHCIHYYVSYC